MLYNNIIFLYTQMFPHPPLKSRIVVTSNNGIPNPSEKSDMRPTSYKGWDMDAMQQAVAEVEKGMSQRQAAECYKVPRSTLRDYISGRSSLSSRSGKPILSEEEENELATFLVEVAKIGFPHTRLQVISKVQEIVESKGKNTVVTHGWWQSFCKRHPDLTLKSAIPLSIARAKATDEEVLGRYFKMLNDCLNENDIFDNPSRIYNCDETGLPLNPTCHKVVDKVGSHNPSYITGNTKAQVTVLACTNATGYAIPPMIILKKRPINQQLTNWEVPGTSYGLSPNGWMNQELFTSWFAEHFLQYAHRDRPLLLLMDGHSSHYSPATITLAAEKGVILFTLPPNTTHLTQPLDRACFSPLKNAWREMCHQFRTNNPGRAITLYDFNKVFSEAWYKAMSMTNVLQAFKVTGIYPFNSTVFNAISSPPKTLMERTGLAYIPLCSPAPPTVRSVTSSDVTTTESDTPNRNATYIPMRQQTSISRFLIKPLPPHAQPTNKEKSAGLILTSEEHLKLLKEKQIAKAEKERKIEERRQMKVKKSKEKAEKQSKGTYT